MRLNADFSNRVLVRYEENNWVPSPMPGVARRMLDRIGEEVARATTIVRFAPGSAFSPHTQDGGEEYLVLDGVFQDEDGDFPEGSYVRNPPNSHHTPAAAEGATILVKLHQFNPDDRTLVQIDTHAAAWDRVEPGVERLELFRDGQERVRVERWAPGAQVLVEAPGGMELLVIEGSVMENGQILGRRDWLRLPPGSRFHGQTGADGARVWIKTGHLRGMVQA